MSRKILVTGAAGFIGYHLCEKLLKQGDEVVGLDNLNDYYDPKLKEARLADNPSGVWFEDRFGDPEDDSVTRPEPHPPLLEDVRSPRYAAAFTVKLDGRGIRTQRFAGRIRDVIVNSFPADLDPRGRQPPDPDHPRRINRQHPHAVRQKMDLLHSHRMRQRR
jgi:nucleoside-diphosphate-sugar epimerase